MNPLNSTTTDIYSVATGTYTTSSNTLSSHTWHSYPPPASTDLVCRDIVIDNRSLAELLRRMSFLQVPSGLDLNNPTVQDAYQIWTEALAALESAHNQLPSVKTLTQE